MNESEVLHSKNSKNKQWLFVGFMAVILAGMCFYFMDQIKASFLSITQPQEELVPLDRDTAFHEHFDLGVYVLGEWRDFTDDRYQSSTYEYQDQHIHLHDGNGTVVHLHKPGVTLQEALATLDIGLTESCLIFDQSSENPEEYCSTDTNSLQVLVDGETANLDQPLPVFDLQRILIWYGNADTPAAVGLMQQVTDEACIYSETCPERGEAPTETCIADPNVPCVVPTGEDHSDNE